MRAVLPGRPQSKRQAVCTAYWDGLRLIAYVSGNTAIVLQDPKNIIQTISVDHVESLSAITIDESSGRIAICNEERVLIFDAAGREEHDLRWMQAHDIIIPNNGQVHSLSWGASEELLVGGSELWLYHLPYSEDPRLIWHQPVANEIAVACFSSDAELIASFGKHDKLVKLWRRLSFELDSTRFDVSYLPHPAAVTDIHWRKPWHNEQNLDSLLYTFSSDNQVRVWSYSDPHSLSVVQLIATIDTNASIEPRRRSIGSVSRKRYVFILDSRDFAHATEKAIQQSQNQQVDHALEHLIEIANRSPEICVVFDGLGHMSVWGLENAGCKSRKPTVVFNVTLVDEVNIQLNFPDGEDKNYTKLCAFGGGSNPASLSVLILSYTGQIDWYESSITHFFDTSPRKDRVRLLSSWSGHDLPIDHIARGSKGDRILSWTDQGQAILWSQTATGTLRRQSELKTMHDVLGVILLDTTGHLLILHSDAISLWDVKHAYGKKLAVSSLDDGQAPASIQQVNPVQGASNMIYFVLSLKNGAQELWQSYLPQDENQSSKANDTRTLLSRSSVLESANSSPLQVVPCDLAPSIQYTAGRRNGANRTCAGASGQIQTLNISFDVCSGRAQQTSRVCFQTNIKDLCLTRTSSSGKCAVVTKDKHCLTIWDLDCGICEWHYEYKGMDEIQKLAWNSTPRGNLVLFVGFSFHALVVGQFRYPALSKRQSAWYVVQNISLRDFTTVHVGDVCWLSSGDLAMGAGNQIFVLENLVTEYGSPILKRSQQLVESKSAAAVVDMASSTLPVFRAEFLSALITENSLEFAEKILRRLYQKLKFFSEGDEIASDLDLTSAELLLPRSNTTVNGVAHINSNVDNENSIELEDVESTFIDYLNHSDIWQLGPKNRQNISVILTNLIKTGRHRKSLDDNALRYLYDLYNTPEDQDLHWRSFVFAARSTSHEALIDLITQHHNGKLTWSVARRTGLFVWLDDIVALQTQLENVARAEYTKREDRNPVDCSVYYFALNKKAVLQGLWRMTFGVREKENTMKLLANNFDEPRWKGTALKNAYALLSKRRFEYAAAFFLLGGSLKDAVNVCVNQLHDIQLAIAITRVWDKDAQQSDSVLQDLLQTRILTRAIDDEQGRWMAAWAYSTLDQPAQAIRAIVRPLHQVTAADLAEYNGPVQSMSFRANDPHLNILYIQLRQSLLKQNKWTSDVLTQKEEWDFVLRNARWWVRAGMDYLALRLVKEWEFVAHQTPRLSIAPTTLVEREERLADKELEAKDQASQEEKIKNEKKKPAPTQFVEPSVDSLLDSFGF